jgi:elongation factor P--beta-lysine ligase
VDKLLDILINRLEKRGIEPHMIYGFIRDLSNIIVANPSTDLSQINKQLHLLGWDRFELDYHTLELATAYYETEGLESLEKSKLFI